MADDQRLSPPPFPELNIASAEQLGVDPVQLQALESLGIGAWSWQPAQGVMLASALAATRLVHPETLEALAEALAGLASDPRPRVLRHPDGSIELSRLEAPGTLRGFFRLRPPLQSANKFVAAFHCTPDALAITRVADGTLLEVNEVFEQRIGYRKIDVLGLTTLDLGLWDNPDDRQRLLTRLHNEGSVQDFEAQLRYHGGSSALNLLYASRVRVDGEECLVLSARDISEQRRQERALAHSRERLNLALDSAALGTWDWHIPSDSLYGSSRAAVLHAQPEAPYQGSFASFFEEIEVSDAEQLRHSYLALLQSGSSHYQNTYSVRLPDGQRRYLENTARLYRDEQGQPLRMVGVVADISERTLREQRLAASEEKFATLFQACPDPICLVAIDNGQVLDINRGFSEVFGWRAEQIVGVAPEHLGFWLPDTARSRVDAVLRGDEELNNVEAILYDAQQQPLTCTLSARHLHLDQRPCVVVTFRNISARKRAEAALQSSQEKFSKAFHASPDAISITDAHSGRYIEVNEGFCQLSGLRPAQIIGRTSGELGLWKNLEQRRELFERLDRSGRVRGMEVTGQRPDGELRTLELSADRLDIEGRACVMVSARDISELKKAQAQIHHLAYHDALTSLPNRALLLERLSQQISRLKRQQRHGALLFIDLDHFKHINDSLGHPVGDGVLKLVTARLEASVRNEDTVSRLGGDEFVVLLAELSNRRSQAMHEARLIAEKLRELLAEPMLVEGHPLQVTPSIGIALIPDHGETAADLLKRADIALYRAKDSGRNTIQLYRSTMQQAASERLRMENDLRQALLSDQFVLHFQPQVEASRGRIIGAEALLRWEHPSLGLQPPGHFIQVLEESGLIQEVGRWVLEEACRCCRQLLDQGRIQSDAFTLCVNLSPRQFRDPTLVEYIAQALQDSRLPPSMLKLEITESIVIQNVDDAIAKMNRLKRLGLRFAMDDFGTGYSSLTYIKRLPVEMLKIDQSFVRDIPHDSNDAEIVRAIIVMAKTLGLEVLAEGVENPEQLAYLRDQGCELYQGYLYSRPLPLDGFADLLAG